MKSFNYRYLFYGLIVGVGAIASIYKQKDPYSNYKKQFNLTMSKENIKNYLLMDSTQFNDELSSMFEKKCGQNNENSLKFDNEEKEMSKIAFLRRVEKEVKKEGRSLTADELKKIMESTKYDTEMKKVIIRQNTLMGITLFGITCALATIVVLFCNSEAHHAMEISIPHFINLI